MTTLTIEHTGNANPLATPTDDGFYIRVLRGSIIPEMACCALIYRYDGEGQYQSSDDGGETWVDAPDSIDPLKGDSFRLPPKEGENARCDSAASITRYLEDTLSEMLAVGAAGATAIGISGTALGLLSGLGIYGVVASLTIAAGSLIIDVGVQVVDDALTTDAYDALMCAIYCNSDANGQISQAQYDAIQGQVEADIGGVGSLVLRAAMLFMGSVGMSNAGAAGLDEDDCSECECAEEGCFDVDANIESFNDAFRASPAFCAAPDCMSVDGTGMYCSYSSINSMAFVCDMEDAWGTSGAGDKAVTVTFSTLDAYTAVGWTSDDTFTTYDYLTDQNNTEVVVPAGMLLFIRVQCSVAHVTRLCVRNAD